MHFHPLTVHLISPAFRTTAYIPQTHGPRTRAYYSVLWEGCKMSGRAAHHYSPGGAVPNSCLAGFDSNTMTQSEANGVACECNMGLWLILASTIFINVGHYLPFSELTKFL